MAARTDFLTLLLELGQNSWRDILATTAVPEVRHMPLHPILENRRHRDLVLLMPLTMKSHDYILPLSLLLSVFPLYDRVRRNFEELERWPSWLKAPHC